MAYNYYSHKERQFYAENSEYDNSESPQVETSRGNMEQNLERISRFLQRRKWCLVWTIGILSVIILFLIVAIIVVSVRKNNNGW